MKKYFIFLLLTTVVLAGCVTLPSKSNVSPKAELVPGQWIQLPKPAQLAFNITATQILTAEYKIQNKTVTYTSQVQVEKTPRHLVLVAVAGWGGEVFSINYNGTTIKTSSLPMPNSSIGIQHVLTDFILTYSNADLLKNLLLTSDIKLVAKPNQRIFILYNKPIIKIDYQNTNPWQGNIALHNFKYNYVIKITTIKVISASRSLNLAIPKQK